MAITASNPFTGNTKLTLCGLCYLIEGHILLVKPGIVLLNIGKLINNDEQG